MIAVRQRKILTILFFMVLLSAVAALVLYALRQNISLFYTPTQVVMQEAPVHQRIRVGGMVEKGSIRRAKQQLTVAFEITDYNQTITIHYNGVLPDLFREGQGVVVEGEAINPHVFRATQVLAKHDENYMPPEVKAALAKKGHA